MTFHEFSEPKPVVLVAKPAFLTAKSPRGNALGVLFTIDQHNMWMVVMDETGEVINVPNNLIRFEENWTYGRRFP